MMQSNTLKDWFRLWYRNMTLWIPATYLQLRPTDLRWYNFSKKETQLYSGLVPFERKWLAREKSGKFNSRQQSSDRHLD